jgi:protein N-terminal glutamine amidohydrolase
VTPRRYAPFWCEENVWWLAQEPRDEAIGAEVAIISNQARMVALWSQRAAKAPELPVVWDYHVVLALRGPSGTRISDLDCTLGPAVSAAHWLTESFPAAVEPRFAPRFRVLDAELYVRTLRSDRSHMLARLIDVEDDFVGERLDLAGLHARWR